MNSLRFVSRLCKPKTFQTPSFKDVEVATSFWVTKCDSKDERAAVQATEPEELGSSEDDSEELSAEPIESSDPDWEP